MKPATSKEIGARLLAKGVEMPLPETVYIGPEVNPDRISGDNVTVHPGTRITGKETLIMAGTQLGEEAPVTLDNCLVGPDCRLKGGFFQGAVFAGKNSFGSGAHVRGGTILEEEAGAAHTVGLKQTILFPFVTLGSLINFCDLFMAGGTSRKDHSEVGSSYIHFNYTPNQDKATPSLLGNVAQGVMLDQPPIFLGGQGGLVGPRTLAFGTVTAAGTICRRDELRPGRLLFGAAMKPGSLPAGGKFYREITLVFEKNCTYIGNLTALRAWYHQIRPLFMENDLQQKALLAGMQATLDTCIRERIKRLEGFCRNLEISRTHLKKTTDGRQTPLMEMHNRLIAGWPTIRQALEEAAFTRPFPDAPKSFIDAVKTAVNHHGSNYTQAIQSIPPDIRTLGSQWLETGIFLWKV